MLWTAGLLITADINSRVGKSPDEGIEGLGKYSEEHVYNSGVSKWMLSKQHDHSQYFL